MTTIIIYGIITLINLGVFMEYTNISKSNNKRDVCLNCKRKNQKYFLSMLERKIKKGKCSYFNKKSWGYDFSIVDKIKEQNYEAWFSRIDDDLSNKLESLYEMANSDEFKEKYENNKKSIHYKRREIIYNNFFCKGLNSIFSNVDVSLKSLFFVMLLGTAVTNIMSVISGNPALFLTQNLHRLNIYFGTATIGALVYALVPSFRAVTRSIKDIRKLNKEQEKSIIEEKGNTKEKTLENTFSKEKTKNIDKEENIFVDKTKDIVQEHSKVISFLEKQYKDLENEKRLLLMNNASDDEIAEIDEKIKAVLIKYNCILGNDNNLTTEGPVRKLTK